jgi:uncharacterized protein (DUF1697 family)
MSDPPVWAVLLRGINVGGHNKVPMAELRAALTDDGFRDVATYIASGNVVVRGDSCEPERIGRLLADRFGLDLTVVVRSADQIRSAAEANPFPEAADEPRFLYCCFTETPVDDDALADFDHERFAPDRLAVAGGEVYAHYADGMGRSKLTNAVIDRAIGCASTARNWNTVLKLVEMVARAEG